MKIFRAWVLSVVLLLGATDAFGFIPPAVVHAKRRYLFGPTPAVRRSASHHQLRMGMFDKFQFQPFHGHGTGEKKRDEIYKEEQAVLKNRKAHHLTKPDLHKKYATKKNENWIEAMFSHGFHGSGSAATQEDLDEMFKAQQQMLYERREYYGNKNMLKKKYKNPNLDHLKDIKTLNDDPALLNKKEDDAMYFDDKTPPMFPFGNKKLKP